MDASLHLFLNYREVSTVDARTFYPPPRMDEFIDSLGDVWIFFTIESNWGCSQVESKDAYRDKSHLSSHQWLYRLHRIPFELCDAPSMFQKSMGVSLSLFKWHILPSCILEMLSYSHKMQMNANRMFYCRSYRKQASLLVSTVRAFHKEHRLPWAIFTAKQSSLGWPYDQCSCQLETTTWRNLI